MKTRLCNQHSVLKYSFVFRERHVVTTINHLVHQIIKIKELKKYFFYDCEEEIRPIFKRNKM